MYLVPPAPFFSSVVPFDAAAIGEGEGAAAVLAADDGGEAFVGGGGELVDFDVGGAEFVFGVFDFFFSPGSFEDGGEAVAVDADFDDFVEAELGHGLAFGDAVCELDDEVVHVAGVGVAAAVYVVGAIVQRVAEAGGDGDAADEGAEAFKAGSCPFGGISAGGGPVVDKAPEAGEEV